MEEILKALAPWPLMQGIVLGMLAAAAGVWAMRRGFQDHKKHDPAAAVAAAAVEDLRARWELQKAIGHIHANSFEIVDLLKRQNELAEMMLAAINRLVDTRWNRQQ